MATDLDTVNADRARRWSEARRRGVGGSDMADLFNLPGPYGGCQRRLWYDKANVPADHPVAETDAMLRGKMLEEAAAQQYSLDTGRRLLAFNRPRVHAEHPWARVNVDRGIVIVPEHRGRGVLEIKTQNAWMFRRTRREGLAEGYILQVQHAMFVTGCEWGAFMVLQPDTWGRARWDVEADPVLQRAIVARGAEFWRQVTQGAAPDKLPADDPRCQSCRFRMTCQGVERMMQAAGLSDGDLKEPVAEDESFAELVEDYEAARQAIAEMSDLQGRIKDAIRSKMAGADAVACSAGRIYNREQTTTRLDVTGLKLSEPAIYKHWSKTTTTRPLRIYAIATRGADD